VARGQSHGAASTDGTAESQVAKWRTASIDTSA
jgi:hypothetical protein